MSTLERAYIGDILQELEEVKTSDNKKEEIKEEVVEHKQKQYSEQEERAISLGWKTKEDWEAEGNDPDEYLGPKAFIRKTKEKEQISHLESLVLDTNNKLSNFQLQQEEEKEREIEKQINTLKAQRNALIEEGEIRKAQELSDILYKMELGYSKHKEEKNNRQQQPNPTVKAKLSKFVEKNEWMKDSPENTKYQKSANLLYKQYTESYPNDSIDEVLDYVKSEMEKKYPELNKIKSKPINRVTGSSYTSSEVKTTKEDKEYNVLKDDEADSYAKNFAKYLEKKGVLSSKDYSKSYKELQKQSR